MEIKRGFDMQVQTEGNPASCTYALRKDVQDQPSLKNQHTSKTSKEAGFPSAHFFIARCLDGIITVRLSWAGVLQTSAACTTYNEQRGSSDHSGEVKHTQHVKTLV